MESPAMKLRQNAFNACLLEAFQSWTKPLFQRFDHDHTTSSKYDIAEPRFIALTLLMYKPRLGP
jgi:hypothetical protein